jgi:hypothetical protein
VKETKNSKCSCLLLANHDIHSVILVMAVRWMEDGISAERIGLFHLKITGPEEFEQVYGPLDKTKRRDVRLI